MANWPSSPCARAARSASPASCRGSDPIPIRPPPRPSYGPVRRRWLLFTAIAVAILVVLGLFSVVYAGARVASIHRISVAGLHPAGPGSAQTILLVGSDSRAGESSAAAQQFGSASQVAGQRSDTIILIHLDPGAGKASMLSIPRDLFVPIASTGASNRINTAFDQ